MSVWSTAGLVPVLRGLRPGFAAVLAGVVVTACGGAPPLRLSPGVFSGPNELAFVVTAPVREQMPPERHAGRAEVVSRDGETLQLRLQMFEGGDFCDLSMAQTSAAGVLPETFTAGDGQQCGSRFTYDGIPVAAIVSIDEGDARYDEDGLHVHLSGRFLANTAGGGVMEGVAAWEFEGTE